jgi:hypothetical protein
MKIVLGTRVWVLIQLILRRSLLNRGVCGLAIWELVLDTIRELIWDTIWNLVFNMLKNEIRRPVGLSPRRKLLKGGTFVLAELILRSSVLRRNIRGLAELASRRHLATSGLWALFLSVLRLPLSLFPIQPGLFSMKQKVGLMQGLGVQVFIARVTIRIRASEEMIGRKESIMGRRSAREDWVCELIGWYLVCS